MSNLSLATAANVQSSPLWICDRLIEMAREADRAGYAGAADALVRLAVGLPDERLAITSRRRRTRLS